MFSLGFLKRTPQLSFNGNRIKRVVQSDRLNRRRLEIKTWIQFEIANANEQFLASNGLSGKAELLFLIEAYATISNMKDRRLTKLCKTLDKYQDSLSASQLEQLTPVNLLAKAL